MLNIALLLVLIAPTVSQSLLDLSLTVIAVCFIHSLFKNKDQHTFQLRKIYFFEYGFVSYFLAIIAGFIALQIYTQQAWMKLINFVWIFSFYTLTWAFSKVKIQPSSLLKVFTLGFLPTNIYALAFYFIGYDWIRHRVIDDRVIGFVNSATYHAHLNALLITFFCILAYYTLSKKNRLVQALTVFSLLLMASSLFLTYTRGAWISVILSLAIFLLIENRKYFFYFAAGLGTFFTILFNFSTQFQNRILHSMNTLNADQERWNLIKVHFLMIKESPWFGIGYFDSLTHTRMWWPKLNLPIDSINSHAHNQILNVFATTGLLGLIPFLLFYLGFFILNIKLVLKLKNNRNSDAYILSVSCLFTQLTFLISNLSDVGFEYAKVRTLILLTWSLVFYLWQDQSHNSSLKVN